MATAEANGVHLYYELHGSGEPLALVHGSWADASQWEMIVPGLAESFQVLIYDRRGHWRSEGGDTPGSIDEDGDDLASLLEVLGLAPAHVVTNSWGGSIALRLATRRPDVFASLTCHEPPLWGLLDASDPDNAAMLQQGAASLESVGRRIAEGDYEGAARQFVDEVAFGSGAWDALPPEAKQMFIRNGRTFLDELADPNQLEVDQDQLQRLAIPLHLTQGSESPPAFAQVIDRLVECTNASSETIDSAGHVPHLTTPSLYVQSTVRAVQQALHGSGPS